MIIRITKSELFTKDPDIRFCNEYGITRGTWKEMWRRYKLMEYTPKELCGYFHIVTSIPISQKAMKRWILRTEIYSKTKPIIDKGAETVVSTYFGDLEWAVIKELTKHLPHGVRHTISSLP
jgi:hypothetical protein